MEVRPTTYRSNEKTVPKYTYYSSVRSDILSADDPVLRYIPYFSECEPENVDSLCLHFTDVVKQLPLKYRLDEEAKRWLPLVGGLLAKWSCTANDVVYYVLDKNSSPGEDGAPGDSDLIIKGLSFAIGDAQRTKLIASLGPRDTARIGCAEKVSHAFFDVVGMSLWEVVKRDSRISPFLPPEKVAKPRLDLYPERPTPQIPPSGLSISPYTTLGCNVCFM